MGAKGIGKRTYRGIREDNEVRKLGKDVQDLADDWFFETAIRLHRAGEGAPYTGMKQSVLDEGPIVPLAEKAIKTGDPSEAIEFILDTVRADLLRRFHKVQDKRDYDANDVATGRSYVQAFIGFVVYAHKLYQYLEGGDGHVMESSSQHPH